MEETKETIMNIIGEEKSVFERAIIEAFKEKSSKQIYEKLCIALDELKYIYSDIKNSPNEKKFLLNKNIIDKFSRIIERKYFNVNILIAMIYENMLDPDNFNILSNDSALLITFANEVLNLLDSIKFTIISRQLEKRCSAFLSYLSTYTGLEDEQKETISELIKNFPTRNSSHVYKTFDEIRDKILSNCRNPNLDEKLEGLNTLMESFGNTVSLEEQFDLLIEKVPQIVKTIIHQPNIEYKDAYFQLGNFICSMLFATKFKLDAYLPEYRIHRDELNKNYFFVIANDELLDEGDKEDMTFLHNSLFELTTQRDILLKCENIYHICSLILSALSIYENVFDLQYVCYIILKRVYFIFPQFRRHIEDILAMTLVNLCCFKEAFERESTEECRHFINYLLKHGDDDLKIKLNKRIEAKNANIEVKFEDDIKDVEFENLRLSDFNLRIGYPTSVEIDAGSELSRYIEVHNPNSLVYVGFATSANDITVHLLKYIASDEVSSHGVDSTASEHDEDNDEDFSDNGHFKPILKVDRIDCSISPVKLVMFVREPGTYKIIFDNHFSWFTGKTLRYRLSVLKPLSEIDVERKVDFETIKAQMSRYRNEEAKEVLSPHSNKILMVKFEGKNRVFKVDNIHSKEQAVRNKDKFEIVPVLVSNNKLRIVNQDGDITEYSNEDTEISYEKFFENSLESHFKKVENFELKTIFLNIFLLEKLTAENTVLPVTDEEFYKNTVTKLGFFPNLPKNLKFCIHNISDCCILYSLYQKILKKDDIKNTIHIHFDKYKAQPALYFDGVINDKISGFNYDYNLSLMENLDNVINFVNKVSMVFGGFELSISFTDIDPKIFEMFADELNKKIAEISSETPIVLTTTDSEFMSNVENLIELFELE